MRKRVSPALVALSILLVAVVTAMIYSRRLPVSPQPAPPTMAGRPMNRAGRSGRRGGTLIPRLGVVGAPNPSEPRGLRVVAFPESSDSPLKLLGVIDGDVIVSCNGEGDHIRDRLTQAIADLQERGEPITIVVDRNGERVPLTRTEKLPPS